VNEEWNGEPRYGHQDGRLAVGEGGAASAIAMRLAMAIRRVMRMDRSSLEPAFMRAAGGAETMFEFARRQGRALAARGRGEEPAAYRQIPANREHCGAVGRLAAPGA